MHLPPNLTLQILPLFLFLLLTLAHVSAVQNIFTFMLTNALSCACTVGSPTLIVGCACDPVLEASLTLVNPATGASVTYDNLTLTEGCQSVPGVPDVQKGSFCVDSAGAKTTFKLITSRLEEEHCLQAISRTNRPGPCASANCSQFAWIDCATLLPTAARISSGGEVIAWGL